MTKTVFLISTIFIVLTTPNAANSLTMREFSTVCQKMQTNCSANPILQAYVGGSLDLLATLDEDTNYFAKLVCNDKRALFKVDAIIEYMLQRKQGYLDKNATLLVVRYMEQYGGCAG